LRHLSLIHNVIASLIQISNLTYLGVLGFGVLGFWGFGGLEGFGVQILSKTQSKVDDFWGIGLGKESRGLKWGFGKRN
jgi:hypothetical protein